MKLNLFIARSGVASRRRSAELVKNGLVRINGKIVLEPFREVTDKDKISVGTLHSPCHSPKNRSGSITDRVEGKNISPERFVYVAVNKPIGVTCTLKDRFAEKKVTDLVPRSLGRLYPVGRLDRDSSGLVILTNDGDFSQRMSHPSYEVEKEYLVTVVPAVNRKEISVLKAGVLYEDEKLSASEIRILKKEPGRSTLQIILKEGKKREIRRMFGCLNHHVQTLERVRIGRITLGNLNPGKWRFLTREEIGSYSRELSQNTATHQ